MNYQGYQQPYYGGMPPMGGGMMPPQGPMYQNGPGFAQGQPFTHGGYGAPFQGGFGGLSPNAYCPHCRGSGYRMKRNGKTKKCKCIKQQEKMMGKYYGNSSSDSD